MDPVHKYKVNSNSGFGLVEVIAALGISVVVLTSLVSLSLFSLRSSLQSKLQLEGTKLANRELELVRAFRDSAIAWENGTDGFLDTVVGCTSAASCHMVFSGAVNVASGSITQGAGAEAITTRFYVTRPDGTALQSGDNEVRVTVEVSWTVASSTKYARLYTDLTNWAAL